jgi:hypothetical protein
VKGSFLGGIVIDLWTLKVSQLPVLTTTTGNQPRLCSVFVVCRLVKNQNKKSVKIAQKPTKSTNQERFDRP